MSKEPLSLGPIRAKLGEAPLWDAASGLLYWLDITGQRLHMTAPETGETQSRDLPGPASAIFHSSRGLAIAMGQSLHLLDADLTKLAALPTGSAGRMNDGKPDPAGRLWIGTANSEGRADCALWRFDGREPVEVLQGITMSNGIGWSPDASRMYYVDSATRRLDVFAYDLASGSVSNRQTLLELPAGHLPDGLSVDSAGQIWLAIWGGAKLLCVAPNGDIARTLTLPTRCASSCAFGGAGLSDLFITTAGAGDAAADPLAGALFKAETSASGLPTNIWKI